MNLDFFLLSVVEKYSKYLLRYNTSLGIDGKVLNIKKKSRDIDCIIIFVFLSTFLAIVYDCCINIVIDINNDITNIGSVQH